ncbi:MAG: branched-chain amino acid ABC transporter ATP-binding protein/permease [Dongiaceae bacterium]
MAIPAGSVTTDSRGSALAFGLSRARLARALFGVAILVLPLALLALVADLALGKAVQGTVTLLFINIIAVIGFGIYSGNTGIMSFGHVAFMNIGAHAAALFTMPPAQKATQLPDLPAFFANAEYGLLPATAITLAGSAIFILVVGWPIARLVGASAIIATLALLGAVYSLSIGAVEFTKGSQALFGVPRMTTLWVAFAFAAVIILLARLYRDSRAGLETQATREDPLAAASIGVAIVPRRLLTWVVSGLVATVAGILMGHFLTVFSPKEFYFIQTFALLAMLIVGGVATVSGAVIGTVLVTVLIEILRRLEEGPQIGPIDLPQIFGLTTLGLGVCMIFVMIKRRDGLIGFRELDERILRRFRLSAIFEPTPAAQDWARSKADGRTTLAVRHLSKQFGGLKANQDISFDFSSDEILGLIGPNGSGKTTLLNMLSRALPPSAGSVTLNGTDITRKPAHWVAGHGVARTFQNIRLFQNLTVFENVYAAVLASGSAGSATDSEARTGALLAQFSLTDQAEALASSLPYGSQRRLEIARALATRPRLLLLDEPAAGMNEVESDALLTLLSELRQRDGIGLLIVEHDLSLILRLCDRIVVLNKGEVIAEGPPDAIQQNPAVIEAYIGTKRSRRPESGQTTVREEQKQ